MIKVPSIIVAAVMGAAPLSAQTAITNPPDPYIQTQTGMRFPAKSGDFERHQVDLYTEDGSDTGVGYQLIKDGKKVGYVSLFVYPAPDAITPEAQAGTCVQGHRKRCVES